MPEKYISPENQRSFLTAIRGYVDTKADRLTFDLYVPLLKVFDELPSDMDDQALQEFYQELKTFAFPNGMSVPVRGGDLMPDAGYINFSDGSALYATSDGYRTIIEFNAPTDPIPTVLYNGEYWLQHEITVPEWAVFETSNLSTDTILNSITVKRRINVNLSDILDLYTPTAKLSDWVMQSVDFTTDTSNNVIASIILYNQLTQTTVKTSKVIPSTTASQLATARTIATSGGATGTATLFDGSTDITIPITSLAANYLSGEIPSDVTTTTQSVATNNQTLATTAFAHWAMARGRTAGQVLLSPNLTWTSATGGFLISGTAFFTQGLSSIPAPTTAGTTTAINNGTEATYTSTGNFTLTDNNLLLYRRGTNQWCTAMYNAYMPDISDWVVCWRTGNKFVLWNGEILTATNKTYSLANSGIAGSFLRGEFFTTEALATSASAADTTKLCFFPAG